MKSAQIKELTAAELDKQMTDSRRELLNLRIQAANGRIENPARIRTVRRTIARLNTELRNRQLKETVQ